MSVNNCKKIKLPKIESFDGTLTPIENIELPFDIKRVFYIYDVPTGKSRGAHAHIRLEEFLVCLSGSFDVEVDDGKNKLLFHLNRPWEGLYIPPMIWSAEKNFDPGTTCLALCSEKYEENDYIRDYELFVKKIKEKNNF